MNTTFNFSRFFKVLSNEWRLNIIKMSLFWGGMIIITILYFTFLRYGVQDIIPKRITFGLLFFLMCILQGFYLQNYYHDFSSKTKTQALLLLPASRNETFWAKFLLGIIFYLAIFSVYIFFVLKWNGIHNDLIMELRKIPWSDLQYKNYQTITFDILTQLKLFLPWLFSISAYLFGITLFKKRPAFKTLVFWLIVAIGLALITCIVYFLFTGIWPYNATPGIVISHDKYNAVSCDIPQMYPELLYGLGVFISMALIFISRVKYNEKTI